MIKAQQSFLSVPTRLIGGSSRLLKAQPNNYNRLQLPKIVAIKALANPNQNIRWRRRARHQ